MRKGNRLLRTGCLVASVAVVGLVATDAWSRGRGQTRHGQAVKESAPPHAYGLRNSGHIPARLEESFDAAAIEPDEVKPVAPEAKRRVSVLVHFDSPRAGRGAERVAAQRRAVKAWAGNVGGIVKYEYDVVLPNVINLRNVPASRVAALRAMPGVVKVEDDQEVHAHLAVSTPLIRALQSQITGAGHSEQGDVEHRATSRGEG